MSGILALTGCRPTPTAVAQPTPTGPTTIVITPESLHTNVKRLGINLSGQTFYDSGQMLRNLTFRNPGFEGETWQSILRCKTTSADACTDENIYTVWPAGFLAGAQVEILSGASAGRTATLRDSTAAEPGKHGVTLQFQAPAPALQPGDFLRVRLAKPGDADAGWWTDLHGGANLATELHDLPPGTQGKQALRIEAAAPGQTAAVSSFFDSYAGRSFVQLRGPYTLTFRAKSIAGKPSVDVNLSRLDTTHGLHTFLSRTVPLTQTWQQFSFSFTADEARSAIGTVGLSFTFAGSSALLDDVALTASAAPGNPTAFRNEVVDALRILHPGVLRYMDNGTDFGSSLDNMLAPPFARERAGASTQEKRRDDIPIGLHEFLVLCQAIGAEPWYTLPAGSSPAEAAALIQYLAADAATPYGHRRATLGQPAPWTSVFPSIHLELGNEQWNARSFAGSTLNDPKAYGQRAADVFRAMRAAPAFQPAHFDLVLGSWATLPWWTGEELKASAGTEDTVALAPYLFSEFNDARSTEAIFGPMFAEPEMISSRPSGYMAQQLAAIHAASPRTGLAVYETNLGTMSGSASQADLDRAVPSLGAGLAVADNMLLMLRELGITTDCLFALPEYINGFSGKPGSNETVPLWGAVVDMGGATDLRRPTFLAEQLLNEAILPTMLRTRITGTDPTWDQPLSSNNKVELHGAHLLQTFAFADGPRRSLILLNLSRDRGLPVHFAGPVTPTGPIQESSLTAPAIDANNEHAAQVTLTHHTLLHLDPTAPYTLPPWSLTTLRWTQPQ